MNNAEARSYDSFATGVFAPLYSYYANEIVSRTGIRSGRCLDVGCGGGHLGLALLQITSLDLVMLDSSMDMLRLAGERVADQKFPRTTGMIRAAVQAIPLNDSCVDLVVSRGSVPFWDNLPAAFREIRRILRPGGSACIFGGLGPPAMRKGIEWQMRQRNPEWLKIRSQNIPHRENGQYAHALRVAGIKQFSVTRNDTGMWIEFGKEAS